PRRRILRTAVELPGIRLHRRTGHAHGTAVLCDHGRLRSTRHGQPVLEPAESAGGRPRRAAHLLGHGDRCPDDRDAPRRGIGALQNATVIMGLPFAFVVILVMIGLYKALRVEANRVDSVDTSLPASLARRSRGRGNETWQRQ